MMNTTTPTRGNIPVPRKSLRRVAACGALAAASLVGLSVATASASINYSGAQALASANSSLITHKFTVIPATTPMAGWSSGQYVIYAIAARDVTSTTPGAWKTYGWYGPVRVTASSTTTWVCSDYDVILGGGSCHYETAPAKPTTLGNLTITGYPGHRYEAQVNLGYWTGAGYSYTGYFKA